MGCDIHVYVEWQNINGEWDGIEAAVDFDSLFCNRNYGRFGILADVRNYSAFPSISPRRGLPSDCSVQELYENPNYHSASWYTIKELMDFNWDQQVEDRRVTRQTGHRSWDGGCTCNPGEGQMTTYREAIGEEWLASIFALADHCDPSKVRIVFWFDN